MNERTVIEAALAEEAKQPFGAGKEAGEQGSVEWLMERVGYVSASRFKDVLDFTKAGKPSAKRTAYLWEKVIERITGQPAQHYENAAMQHGTMTQPMANMAYESFTGAMVIETGFHKHPTIPYLGASPDGFLDDDGGIEIKCPFNSAVHLQCFLTGVPDEHMPQIHGSMLVTGRRYWDFVSFDPRMPEPLNLYIQRIERDAEYLVNMEAEILKFLAEVNELHAKLMEGK